MTTIRRIFKTPNIGSEILRELLQNIFVGELLNPSKKPVWFVSRWISNIPLIDNRSGAFDVINPEWRGQFIKLEDIIIHMHSLETEIFLVANKQDPSTSNFLQSLERRMIEADQSENIKIIHNDLVHIKRCLVNDYGSISGSMNITFNGILMDKNHEEIIYQTDLGECDKDRDFLAEQYIEKND